MDIVSDSIEECGFTMFFDLSVDIFQRLFEDLQSTIDLFIAYDDRWFDTDRLGTIESTTYEYSPLEEL